MAGEAGGEAGGEWEAAPSIPGTLLVNLGDMTHRWTNGRYKSTWHRVKANSRNGARSRYSMPFFCNLVRRQETCARSDLVLGIYIWCVQWLDQCAVYRARKRIIWCAGCCMYRGVVKRSTRVLI